METSKLREELKKFYRRLGEALKPLLSLLLDRRSKSLEKAQGSSIKPQVFAYRLLGEETTRLLPLFKDVDVNLRRSGMRVSFKGYVSLAVFTTGLLSASVMILVPLMTLLLFHMSVFSSMLFGVGATLFAFALTLIGFYAYPILRADSLKRNLEEELPFTTGYLAILTGAGVPPAQMFRSLAQIDSSLAVSREAKRIVRDVELFGVDIISALESTSKQTPSEKFKEMLEGFIATVHSGGNLTKYLSERSRQYMRLKKIALRRLGDTLEILAEFYVAILVAGPLMLVVMLAVMAMLGGGMSGLLNPELLLNLLTYLGIPLGSVVFLILVDMISPKR